MKLTPNQVITAFLVSSSVAILALLGSVIYLHFELQDIHDATLQAIHSADNAAENANTAATNAQNAEDQASTAANNAQHADDEATRICDAIRGCP